jgi:hypothetical protein
MMLCRLDRFIIDFVLTLIFTNLIGFGCRADHFSNRGLVAKRDRYQLFAQIRFSFTILFLRLRLEKQIL